MTEEPQISYRIEIVDGPSRLGSIEMSGERIPLPLLIDINISLEGTIPGVELVALGDGWSEKKLDIVRDRNASGPWEDPIVRYMESQGIGRLKGAIEYKRSRLLIEGVQTPASVISLIGLIGWDTKTIADVLARARMGASHPPLYLSSAVDGRNLETMFYLGAEIMDTSCAHRDASSGLIYTDDGVETAERNPRSDMYCSCDHCSGRDHDAVSLGRHNVDMMRRRLSICVNYLKLGRLREHVMGQISGKPDMASLVRRFESGSYPRLLECAHSFRKADERPVTYRDDIRDPDFQLWAHRMMNEYVPPPMRRVLLLLPCSARKPYSASRTHQRIRAQLARVKHLKEACQQVVLTSPLGAVPMELDVLYPPSYYDIPVTGEWYPEEIERMKNVVLRIIDSGKFTHVVCHHQEGGEIFRDEAGSGRISGLPFLIEKDPAALAGSLSELIGGEGPGHDRGSIDLVSLMNYSLASCLSWDSRSSLRSIRDRTLIYIDRTHFAEMRKGGPVPTLDGGRAIWGSGGGRRVIIDDFSPRGTVFAQGIKGSDEGIRPGDIVLVGTEEEYRGVGRAILPGPVMSAGARGPAVSMISHTR
ncbi:MAG: DUF5591 domain-containing protein [Candidatus Thermoplasmatota archaeon]|nr:DUF5591 domain-containing protein [Candidatus Thermoplasmatota archaeon]